MGAERFLAEIKTTAKLQHPHILPLFDSGDADGFLFYVMPFVEGESLRERLDREHQLPVEEAVRIASNVAEALGYAHRHGVIHRDIKPANVLLQDGKPVVSDFGIALAVGVAGGSRLTETGLSLGTPHYMSPEQATGDQSVGPATDLWAVGCVLYEMLVGEPPYTGSTPQAILGRIITGEPAPVTEQRGTTPAHIVSVVGRALEKVPADRFASADEFASALADSRFSHREKVDGRRRRRVAAIAVPAFVVGALAWAGITSLIGESAPDADAPTVRFVLAEGRADPLARTLAIAPGGGLISVSTAQGQSLQVRSLSRSDSAVALPAGTQPFFSPNGEWIGFVAGNSANVMRVPVTGGAPVRVATSSARGYGGTWVTDETIVFATTLGLHRVAAEGGRPELLAAPDPSSGELFYAWPQALPGGRGVLFTVVPDGAVSDSESYIAVLDLQSLEQAVVLRGGSSPRYAPSGHLIYSSGGRLHAIRFDASTRETRGESALLETEPISLARGTGADFDVAHDGTLMYRPAAAATTTDYSLVWVGDGREEPLQAPPARYVYPRVSPDGSRILVDVNRENNRDLHVWNIARGQLERITRHPTEDFFGEWSLDGARVFFNSERSGRMNIFSRAADGSGDAQLVLESEAQQMLMGLTPDGDRLLVRDGGAQQSSILSLALGATVTVDTLVSGPFISMNPSVSPDGDWLAYQSDVSGQNEVYVVPFRTVDGSRVAVSTDGGRTPLWSRTGDELFFETLNGDMMVAELRRTPTLEVVEVTTLFSHVGGPPAGGRDYDVSPLDGRFITRKPLEAAPPSGVVVVLNWLQEVERLLPD